ncbi:MAG: hypothetical protein LW823_01735 [Rickettsiales bacterium]|jgi:hypothetical protein|nr:hypothetical protein [Rickettsiales bacterium]
MRLKLFITLLLIPSFAFAGAWTQPAGKGQVIVNTLYYSTDELFNNQGNKVKQARYSKYELNPYFEYGLTDAITAGANLSFQRASQSSATNWGVGDSEFFLRTRLFQSDGLVFSLEPMLKLPSPESFNERPQLGGRSIDAGLGASLGYGFSAWGQNHFVNIDAGYRHRFNDPKDQIKLAGTLGVSVTDTLMILPQIFATYRVSDPSVVSFTQSSGDDYNLLKGQISVVYRYQDGVSFQLGAFSHLDGKNVGSGDGVLFSVWKSF